MKSSEKRISRGRRYTSRPVLGIAILAVVIAVSLILVRQSEYFQLRPASGSAAALAEAAAPPTADK